MSILLVQTPTVPERNDIFSVADRIFAKVDPDAPIWIQLPGEISDYYLRFQSYLVMGERRSVLGCYNRWRNSQGLPNSFTVPESWKRVARAWRWRFRAEAFDRYDAWEKMQQFSQDQAEQKRRRMNIMDNLRARTEEILDAFMPGEQAVRFGEIVSAIKLINSESRIEFDDVPATKYQVQFSNMADLLRAAEAEQNDGSHGGPVIDAEFSEPSRTN